MSEEIEIEQLPVKLTQDEILTRADEIVKINDNREEVDSYLESAKLSAKSQLKKLDDTFSEICSQIRSGCEYRNVEIRKVFDWESEPPVVNTVRLDTGETVRTRPVTLEEKQLRLEDLGENAPLRRVI